ncbi:MAG: hypothetical protein P1U61_07115 [Legionellaceae bacterium]|nr:hypothetical protein [Legionellaceae bacterium]
MMSKDSETYESKPIYFLRNLTISTITMVGLSPFFNACSFVSTRCITDELGPRDVMNHITEHWKKPRALLDGVKQTALQQLARSFVRNGIWFKKDALDEAFPQTSKYIIPVFFAGTEILLNPSMVTRTRIQMTNKILSGKGDMFLGTLPGVLKVMATTGIYVQVKPPIDYVMRESRIHPDSLLGACVSAPLIATPITLLAHPLERIRTMMQSASSHKLGFFDTSAAVVEKCIILAHKQGIKDAIRFTLRGWQPALLSTTVFTIAFNLMILMGKQDIEEPSPLMSLKAPGCP